ncbi:hypothetical protein PVAG01_11207 [Phlyctema vagabunda]|uniref:Metallo-beta-lactamase domain-containing protein n=1 Tax=Phlyctema vagabunda TaxID=108571 RepID=A0ABR4P1N5_9HELO
MAQNLTQASIPAYACPPGTKVHLLNLGTLQCDEGWILRGANTSLASDANPKNKRRDLVILSILIDHPDVGLILFETGCPENIEIKWAAPLTDVFPRVTYNEEHRLPAAIKATGHDIKDIKAVIIGHLHLDHAGGLEHFLDTGIPIYVHEEEFKHACWAVATGADLGVYLGDYMNLESLNWQTFTEPHLDIFQGISLHHSPGHTPGLVAMQVNLKRDGTFIFTTDQFHVKENYEALHPHGWLARDHTQWVRSSGMLKNLERLYKATMVFGHDMDVYNEVTKEKKVFE